MLPYDLSVRASGTDALPAGHGTPAISDYALIGDCRVAALVSNAGSIDWLCFPHFSGPSVFAKLLDPNGGCFSICPSVPFTAKRRYIDDTAVLETIFETEDGSARVLDCLPLLDGIASIRPMREVLRIVEGIKGTVPFAALVDPRPDYARTTARPRQRGRLGWAYLWNNEILNVHSDLDFSPRSTAVEAAFTITETKRHYVSLSYSQGEMAVIPPLGAEADNRLEQTLTWWRNWCAQVVYKGPYRADVVRSAVTLKLMTFILSGAIIASPTTSLPEELGGSRNWDYRYCWLRDAGMTMEALIGLGVIDDARAFLTWLLHATRQTQPRLQIMYDIYGRENLEEHELTHLAGYRNSRPVRIGNGAHGQQQLDVYGEVVHAAWVFSVAGGRLDAADARMLKGVGDVVCKIWREPDSGIWEKRGQRHHYTFSKVMCWVALDRLIKMHEDHAIVLDDVASIQRERDAIYQVVEDLGFNASLNAYSKFFGSDRLDASLLLMPIMGYRKASDERVASTFSLVCDRLAKNGLLSRYEPEANDLRKTEGTFGICSFWAIQQLAMRGEFAQAEKRFVHMLSFGNDVGLFAEEIDAASGEALGNFPQAFTHVGLINSALALEQARPVAPDKAKS
jgi:GH15 family glucan-1,4-alpha-glucosidase